MAEDKPTTPPIEPKAQPSMIESATQAANRLKAENERMETNIKRLEELKSFEALGGKTDGAPQTQPPKEMTAKEYKDEVMKGKTPLK